MPFAHRDIAHAHTDILIIGSGGAGLFAALHAARTNPALTITVIAKGLIGKSGCTRMVQGGYNAAVVKGDSVARHFMDTIIGGKWLPNQDMAWRLCETAITRIHELENEIGCFFDRNPDGSLHGKAFAGQSCDRTLHKSDLTGIEIINRLMEKVTTTPQVQCLNEHRAVRLIPAKDKTGIAGAFLIDIPHGSYRYIAAKAILLATGAGPTMYRYHTPSGDKTCDGLAMALDLGLPLRDMEMVQFHPTGLLGGDDTRMTGTVLEEGLRGAGGHLLNGEGSRFMHNYDKAGERATRDIVSRAMYAEMQAGRRLYISMAHLGSGEVARRFPGMVKRCADCGFDLAGGKVEVVPTAHYMMGGVISGLDTATSIDGLFVAGEDCGGVHGANRLGGNGVANSTVFGGIAGEAMAHYATSRNSQSAWRDPDPIALDQAIALTETPFTIKSKNSEDIFALRDGLATTMWDDVGVMRDKRGLQQAQAKLSDYRQALTSIGLGMASHTRAFNMSWQAWLNMHALIKTAQAITTASLLRENSCGSHYRQDFPQDMPADKAAFTIIQQQGDTLTAKTQGVDFTLVKPGESLV